MCVQKITQVRSPRVAARRAGLASPERGGARQNSRRVDRDTSRTETRRAAPRPGVGDRLSRVPRPVLG